MNRTNLALFVMLLLAGFLAGRYSVVKPIQEQARTDTSGPLYAAWLDFERAQRQVLEQFRSSSFFEDDQERAEAYRGLLYNLIGAIKTGVLQDPDHPRFMRVGDWSSKSGLENPDNVYFSALVRDDTEYRIVGQRGSSSNLVLQLVVGQPGVRGAGTSTNVSVLNDSEMHFLEDGSFEVLVSESDPGPDRNWLPNGAGAETLLVRFSHSDWSSQRPGSLRIEKIGAEGEHAVPLTPTVMAAGLRESAVNLVDSNATWLEYAELAWNRVPRNAISGARPTQGGLVGQYSAFGSWELNNEQAIILSTVRSAASYQGIQLGNLWFVSLDYETRTSSLTLDQMQCSADGRCYAVISHRDPGIQNWLDTEGHRRGLIMMRWQGLSAELPQSQQPRARLVDFASLREVLPVDIPVFSATQRRQQIQNRRAGLHQRISG